MKNGISIRLFSIASLTPHRNAQMVLKNGSPESVEVQKLTIRADRVLSLKPDERFAYYALGHFFNELMFVQKLIGFALPKHEDNQPFRQQPEMGQVMFLFRIAAGKMYEARLAMLARDLSEVLKRSFFPLLDKGAERFKSWQRQLATESWLKDLRNNHSFHYPKFADWQKLVESPGDWEDDQIFMSHQSGNVFYAGSDNMAQHWMFGQMNAQTPGNAVEPMINELIGLLSQFNSLVEDLLGSFITQRLLDSDVQRQKVGIVEGPNLTKFELPFWMAMPQEQLKNPG